MKQAKRIFSLLLALAMTVVLLTGCVSTVPQEITVEDLTITLPGHYRNLAESQQIQDASAETTSFFYGYMDILLVGVREPFSLFGADKPATPTDYALRILEKNGTECQVTTENGMTVFEFTQQSGDTAHTYLAAVFESSDAYWLLQAGCTSEHFAGNRASFLEYFGTVKVQ